MRRHVITYKTSVFYRQDFTGKEKDTETGYGYFGARYMDHELMTMWLSVDPMADKYPSISPYNYCMWNPVRLVDPDGREIWIYNGSEKIKYDAGMSSDGLTGFSKITVDALNSIYFSCDEGAELITTLCSSDNTFNIKQQNNKKPSEFVAKNQLGACARSNESIINNWQAYIQHGGKIGSGGDVLWRYDGYDIITEKGLRNDPVFQLIHELCHAYDATNGNSNNMEYCGLALSEWSACIKSNCIGSYMGFPKQTIYGGSVDAHGIYIENSGIRLFDADGNVIDPF